MIDKETSSRRTFSASTTPRAAKEQAPEPVIKIAGLGGTKKPNVQDVVHKKAE